MHLALDQVVNVHYMYTKSTYTTTALQEVTYSIDMNCI